LQKLCHSSSAFHNLTLVWQHFKVMPPPKANQKYCRYESSGPDTVLQVECRPR
jgi:hypothetical protein